MSAVTQFFATARERYRILLRRRARQPWPWTSDRIFRENRFCNVFREDDRTTQWFREHLRDPLSEQPDRVLAATVGFTCCSLASGRCARWTGDCAASSRW